MVFLIFTLQVTHRTRQAHPHRTIQARLLSRRRRRPSPRAKLKRLIRLTSDALIEGLVATVAASNAAVTIPIRRALERRNDLNIQLRNTT